MRRLRIAALALVVLAVLVGIGSMVAQWTGRGDGATGPAEPRGAEEEGRERVRVEVLNAAGIAGLARAATERARDAGFDVVDYRNAPAATPDSSIVLDRVGRPDLAAAVAGALVIPRVDSRPDSTLFVDVTVVLGRDWAGAGAAPN